MKGVAKMRVRHFSMLVALSSALAVGASCAGRPDTPPVSGPSKTPPPTAAPAPPPPAIVPAPSATPLREPDVIYVPTPQNVVESMLKLARVTESDVVYDLGSGDGRIPITAAQKYGARAI